MPKRVLPALALRRTAHSYAVSLNRWRGGG